MTIKNSPFNYHLQNFKSEMQVKDLNETNTNVTKSKQVNAHKIFIQNGTENNWDTKVILL
jgi:hypothetical protein